MLRRLDHSKESLLGRLEALEQSHGTRYTEMHRDLACVYWEVARLRADVARLQVCAAEMKGTCSVGVCGTYLCACACHAPEPLATVCSVARTLYPCLCTSPWKNTPPLFSSEQSNGAAASGNAAMIGSVADLL
jgi:hypothetical protein